MSDINHEARAARAWIELVAAAGRRETISYGVLSDAVGVHHRASRYFLEPIQQYCLDEKLPPLTILVVNQGGRPGPGFIAWDVDDFEQGVEKVFNYNWVVEANPFEYAKENDTLAQLADSVVKRRSAPEDVYRQVKVRGVSQQLFREILLNTYGRRCAMCGLSFEPALEACHIKPWSECDSNERLDPQNGILLCGNHHSLLDAGVLELTEDWRIQLNPAKARLVTEGDRWSTERLDGARIALPEEEYHRPNRRYLSR